MKRLKSIRFKFLCCLLGIAIIPILILFGVMLKNNARYYAEQISMASDNEVKKQVSNINRTFVNVGDLVTSLIFSQYDNDSCMLSICAEEGKKKELTPMQRLTNYRKYEYVTSNLISNNQYAQGVYLFTESGYTYSFVKNKEFYLEEDYKNAEWYKNLNKSKEVQIIENWKSKNSKTESVLFARKFTDIKGEHMGILAVVCSDEMFGQIGDNSLPWGDSFVMDSQGRIIDGDKVRTKLEQEEIEQIIQNESGVLPRKNSNNAYVYGTLAVNNWKIISEVSFDSEKQLYMKNMGYLLWVILAILALVALFAYLLERVFIKPLVNLSVSMEKAQLSNKQPDEKYRDRKDEIGSLYRHFDKMMKKINKLIEDTYIGEIKFLKSRLQILMSQINAHFIFNTLENINCLAKIEKNTQIATMSKSLGDMLRYSIEYEEDEEILSTEIRHIKDYINIQEIRFGNPIHLITEGDERLYHSRVMKFMLQPVIENAIEHGLAGEELPWIIRVSVYRESNELVVWVQDNGAGMEEEMVREVKKRIYCAKELPEDARYTSIGLSNIHKRIRLLYNEPYGLTIAGVKGGGTAVEIRIPYHEAEEEKTL